MGKVFVTLTVLATLACCARDYRAETAYREELNAWLGRPIRELIAQWGNPVNTAGRDYRSGRFTFMRRDPRDSNRNWNRRLPDYPQPLRDGSRLPPEPGSARPPNRDAFGNDVTVTVVTDGDERIVVIDPTFRGFAP